ncbi:hypothetical protein [Paraburkholderia sp. BL10I2N1]|uniref:hypothetical protein n=1 Tax=Paraburkholderia sp. BL10I2N1 TaxID=1938796 RepID=UPI00105BA05C|nr:hypothetical protein [Paraburkholderia sp. BL10I2N1]TDN61119.1 hypothetical protein B0G77_4538 [Paraburkholderia sp. BL10I2N1]
MATLARRLFKVALFVGLFCLAVPYVHTYPIPMPESQALVWLYVANRLGIRDPDDLFFVVTVTIDLIVAAFAYVAIIRLWRYYWTKRRSTTARG